MKQYKINTAYPVNKMASKTGMKWEYRGKKTLEEAQEIKTSFENNIKKNCEFRELGYCVPVGLRITDLDTNEIIYEKTI